MACAEVDARLSQLIRDWKIGYVVLHRDLLEPGRIKSFGARLVTGVVYGVVLLVAVVLGSGAGAASRRQECLTACEERIARCVQVCGPYAVPDSNCRRAVLKRCRREGVTAVAVAVQAAEAKKVYEKQQIPIGVSKLVMDCVRQDPAERPSNMMDVISRLDLMIHSIFGGKIKANRNASNNHRSAQ